MMLSAQLGAQNRSRVGHLEADTIIGNISDKHCVLTLVDARKSGYVMIGKLEARTVGGHQPPSSSVDRSGSPTYSAHHHVGRATGPNSTAMRRLKVYRQAMYRVRIQNSSRVQEALRRALPLVGKEALPRPHERADSSVPTKAYQPWPHMHPACPCNRIAHKLNTRPVEAFPMALSHPRGMLCPGSSQEHFPCSAGTRQWRLILGEGSDQGFPFASVEPHRIDPTQTDINPSLPATQDCPNLACRRLRDR